LSADDVVELYCRASSANNVEFMRAMETSVVHAAPPVSKCTCPGARWWVLVTD